MMWWIAALLFVFLALDVVVKSTGASSKTAIPTRVEIVNAIADRAAAFVCGTPSLARRSMSPNILSCRLRAPADRSEIGKPLTGDTGRVVRNVLDRGD